MLKDILVIALTAVKMKWWQNIKGKERKEIDLMWKLNMK
jgi:ABC-type antimicrobial peptide transport system ATPase subunit